MVIYKLKDIWLYAFIYRSDMPHNWIVSLQKIKAPMKNYQICLQVYFKCCFCVEDSKAGTY